MNENHREPPETWRYVDWIGGQEAFDKMFAEYPPELKVISEMDKNLKKYDCAAFAAVFVSFATFVVLVFQ